MQDRFNSFVRKVIREITTPINKRRDHDSRYNATGMYPKASVPRKIQNLQVRRQSAGQGTKLGYQQYMGNPFTDKGSRGKNASEKNPNDIGIAKGIGGYKRGEGVNPKASGAAINSKQGNMVVKYNLANGKSKVGNKGKTNFSLTQREFMDNHLNN